MARPGPTIICEHVDDNTTIQIGEADAVYAVVYRGKPIKLRRFNDNLRYQGYKYSKTSFPEAGHALRLARHLNEQIQKPRIDARALVRDFQCGATPEQLADQYNTSRGYVYRLIKQQRLKQCQEPNPQ